MGGTENGILKRMAPPLLDLQHVTVARGETTVLKDISLNLAAGEHLAILGPNGCGKSTLLKTLTCELYPLAVNPDGSRPTVRLFGRDRWDLTQLRQRLGVVAADLPGKSTLATSGLDAILTGFFASSTLWPHLTVTPAMRERARELLAQVGAEPLRDRLVGCMSAGQQRRIMIARALAGSRAASSSSNAPDQIPDRSSEMLLLDEPSNALDLAAQAELRSLLRDLARRGVSLLLITHHTADIIPEIDRVLLLREGRIAADGPKAGLLTAPVLSELFAAPLEVRERDGYYHAW